MSFGGGPRGVGSAQARLTRRLLAVAVALASAISFIPTSVRAQSIAAEVPPNAQARSYGSGWECDLGYREDQGACVAIQIPANAYPTGRSYGDGWDCAHGYRRQASACVEIVVPDNAYLTAKGDDWQCDRLFQRVGAACEAIAVPDYGYLIDR